MASSAKRNRLAVRLGSPRKTRSIQLRLPVDLLDAVAEMGLDAPYEPRHLKGMIECSLMWAVWAHSRGRGPDVEIGRFGHGYDECEAIVRLRRERRQVEYLEQLYRLGERIKP
jgi:hypothetical protein